jgi:hypothetical protein
MESRGHFTWYSSEKLEMENGKQRNFTWYSSEKLEMENGKQRTLHLVEFRKTGNVEWKAEDTSPGTVPKKLEMENGKQRTLHLVQFRKTAT